MNSATPSAAPPALSTVWAILLILFGFLAIGLPFVTSWGVLVVVAWLIVISGIVQFIHAFQSHGVGSIIWKLIVAALYVAFGGYLLAHPVLGIAALTLALVFFLVAEGISDIIAWFQSRSAPGAIWVLVDGAVTLIVGLLIWMHWPASSLWVIGTLVGVSMVMTGFSRLMLGRAARSAAHSAA